MSEAIDSTIPRAADFAACTDLSSATSLAGILQARALWDGSRTALNFLSDGQEVGASLDYRTLDARARAMAAVLRRHAVPGDRALILLPSGPDYLVAFFGCFYAAVIAVPAYPPQTMRPQHVARLRGMVADATPRLMLTDSRYRTEVDDLCPDDDQVEVVNVDEVAQGASAKEAPALLAGDDVAFLQYTSGSTATPKGVEVTHANLIDNQQLIARAAGLTAEDVLVSWLPLYHDMGLMAGLTLSVFCGAPLFMMTPQQFLARPARWLQALHRYGGTFSGGPDFAFRLCCERIASGAINALDLGRWRFAFCGSEPVRADTMADFAARFAPTGFKAEALAPSYGLAEATLGVSMSPWGQRYRTLIVDPTALAANRVVPWVDFGGKGPETAIELVSSGRPPQVDTVAVFDPHSLQPCGDGEVGEVWVSGASVTRGYWKNPEATRKVFVQRPEESGTRRWLRSGDLGFLLDGDLFITGRHKDLIILRGENFYPQDIEKAVEAAVTAARKGRVAVFSVEFEGREGIGVAAEIGRGEQRKRDPQDLVEAIDGAVIDALQEPASLIALLEPGVLPKTTSGKLQRSACRQAVAGGDSGVYYLYQRPSSGGGHNAGPERRREPLRNEHERRLAETWQETLGLANVGRDDSFLALGGHSLLALQVVEALRSRFDLQLSLRQLFSTKTLGELAAELVEVPKGAAGLPALTVRPRSGHLPLSLAQQRLWLAQRLAGDTAARAYTMTGYVDLTGRLSVEALERALNGLMARHEILRTAYPERADGLPATQVRAVAELDLPVIDLSGLGPDAQARYLERIEVEEVQKAFDLAEAPLLRTTLLRRSAERHRLVISMHHLIGDAWSFGVLVDDLGELYRAALEARSPALAPLPLQYLDYAFWQRDWVESAAAAQEAAFWRSYLDTVGRSLDLPCDFPRPATFNEAGDSLRFALPGTLVARLEEVGRARGATLFMVLLAAFEVLLYRVSGVGEMVIGTDIAGRSDRALESLIGFFVNVLPLRARPEAVTTFEELLAQVREDSLLAFEHPLLPFDRIVEAVGAPRERARNPLVQVLFVLQSAPRGNLGVDGLSAELHPAKARMSKFDMVLFLDPQSARDEQGLDGEWVFATSLFKKDTIERLLAAWRQLLACLADAPSSRFRDLDLPTLEGLAMPIQQPQSPPPGSASRIGAKLDRLNQLAAAPATARPRQARVRAEPLAPAGRLPLKIEPIIADLDPAAWAASQREWIEGQLRHHGALLFRDFALATPQDFEAFAEAIHPGLYGDYGDLPKKDGGRNTYRSTPYPQDQMILFHNESAHLHRWPRKQWFYCEQPCEKGGATPLVDCREMYRRLPRDIAERFENLGLLYQRSFTDKLDVNWRDFFKADSRAEVEAACRAAGTEFTWFGADELQTRTRCPAVIVHPLTGEKSFFNQVQLHHTRCLAPGLREDLVSMVGEDRLPRQVFFGDGTPIGDEVMDQLGALYESCAVRFVWRKGDVVMLDNMLAAHARDPFEGPRRIVVAMGDMVNREDIGWRAVPAPQELGERR